MVKMKATGNAQDAAYYPGGYYITEPWGQEGSWEGETATEILGQKQQGEEPNLPRRMQGQSNEESSLA